MNDTTKAAADPLDGIKPSAWQTKAKDSTTWIHCTEGVAEWMTGSPSAFSHYELRGLYDRAAIEAAIERARAEERERCKKVCEAISDQYREREGLRYPELRSDAETGAGDCAAAIEALGTTMINGLTRAETDASASCAGLSAKTGGGKG